MDRQTDGQSDRWRDGHKDIIIGKLVDKRTDVWTDREMGEGLTIDRNTVRKKDVKEAKKDRRNSN
jgi:hypothetical protein